MSRKRAARRRLIKQSLALSAVAVAPKPFVLAQEASPLETIARRAGSLDQLRSLIIRHRGETVFENAFRGPSLDRPVNIKSVSKTLVALLTGVAIERGYVPGPNASLGQLAPGLIPASAAPGVNEITLADLLTMRAGLERTSGPNYGAWVQSRNWVADALSRPMVTTPGERFQYSTGSYHVLGAVLSEVTGRSLLTLARDWLGAPLGIEIPSWTRDPQGNYMGGNNMALSPSALSVIGEMAGDAGAWRQKRVVPADWIETSWQPRTRSPYSGDDYGFGWFLRRIGGKRFAYARGYGGQMLYVCRDMDLNVAITSDPSMPARSSGYISELNQLVSEITLSAAAGEF